MRHRPLHPRVLAGEGASAALDLAALATVVAALQAVDADVPVDDVTTPKFIYVYLFFSQRSVYLKDTYQVMGQII